VADAKKRAGAHETVQTEVSKMLTRWVSVASVAALVILTALRAMTFAPADQPLTLGLVDMQKLIDGYKALQEDDTRYRQTVQRRQQMLEVRELLEPKEWEELDALEQKEAENKLSDAERKRLEELRKLTEQRRAEIDRLRLKGQLTDEERKRLEYLQNVQRSNQPKLQALADKFRQELDEINRRVTQMHHNRIRDAAKQVAQQLGLKLVLIGDEDTVLYAEPTLDITERVLAILNSGK
jgi:Skp family chaperone for outer membrane proteins